MKTFISVFKQNLNIYTIQPPSEPVEQMDSIKPRPLNFNKPGGSYNYTTSKIEMNHQKRTKTRKIPGNNVE